MTLAEAVTRHASLLCEQELARRRYTVDVEETTRAVTSAVAQWLAVSASSDATLREAMETIYLQDRLRR
jgi:hypothetical protein